MKKFLIAAMVGGLALVGLSPSAMAGKPGENGISLERGQHLKVDICHWANGHPHKVPVSVSAVTTEQNVKHGSLTLNAEADFVSFTAHDAPGHKTEAGADFVLRVYKKHGNVEVNTYVNPNQECGTTPPPGDPELVTLTACLNGTVTTFGPGVEAVVDAQLDAFLDANEDAVVGSVCPVEETTTTTTTIVTTTTTENNPSTGTPATGTPGTPVAAPTGQLPHTGSNTALALIGAALLAMGAAAYGVRRFVTN